MHMQGAGRGAHSSHSCEFVCVHALHGRGGVVPQRRPSPLRLGFTKLPPLLSLKSMTPARWLGLAAVLALLGARAALASLQLPLDDLCAVAAVGFPNVAAGGVGVGAPADAVARVVTRWGGNPGEPAAADGAADPRPRGGTTSLFAVEASRVLCDGDGDGDGDGDSNAGDSPVPCVARALRRGLAAALASQSPGRSPTPAPAWTPDLHYRSAYVSGATG
jgi:hypothetical protein